MLWGAYSFSSLVTLFIQSLFIQNILLFYFLGMCSYLACSSRLKTANGLGLAVLFVMTVSGVLNWFVHHFITKRGALAWLSFLGVDAEQVNLEFLELILFISVIAAFVQVLEMLIDRLSPALYSALGVYLPLITVNCAILGACLFASTREYPWIANFVFMVGSGLGWWLAICLIASIREKLRYSHIPQHLQGMGITFIVSGFIALGFLAFAGMDLNQKPESSLTPQFETYTQTASTFNEKSKKL